MGMELEDDSEENALGACFMRVANAIKSTLLGFSNGTLTGGRKTEVSANARSPVNCITSGGYLATWLRQILSRLLGTFA